MAVIGVIARLLCVMLLAATVVCAQSPCAYSRACPPSRTAIKTAGGQLVLRVPVGSAVLLQHVDSSGACQLNAPYAPAHTRMRPRERDSPPRSAPLLD